MRLGNCEIPTAPVRKSKIPEFKRRTLVHFAVDTECVRMTTRLAGDATRFMWRTQTRGEAVVPAAG